MARYGIAPTKTNLLRLKTDHAFAKEGHGLLEQKKDILMGELLALVDRARIAQRNMDAALSEAFDSLRNALVRTGRNAVAQTAAAVTLKSDLSVSSRRVMGVALPIVEISVREVPPSFSPGETTFWVDETILRFAGALKQLGGLIETKVSLTLLADEVKKTLRRVNALEKIALPDLQESLKYIAEALEEMEREAFFTMKLVKNRLTQRRADRGTA
jgi:V/A-type H+-transporting ATPase subunit D